MKSRNRRLRSRSASQARRQARSRIFHSHGISAEAAETEQDAEHGDDNIADKAA